VKPRATQYSIVSHLAKRTTRCGRPSQHRRASSRCCVARSLLGGRHILVGKAERPWISGWRHDLDETAALKSSPNGRGARTPKINLANDPIAVAVLVGGREYGDLDPPDYAAGIAAPPILFATDRCGLDTRHDITRQTAHATIEQEIIRITCPAQAGCNMHRSRRVPAVDCNLRPGCASSYHGHSGTRERAANSRAG